MNEENNDRPNSVKLSVNAKGAWSGECKVYSDTIDDAMNKAKEKAEEMAVMIKAKNEAI